MANNRASRGNSLPRLSQQPSGARRGGSHHDPEGEPLRMKAPLLAPVLADAGFELLDVRHDGARTLGGVQHAHREILHVVAVGGDFGYCGIDL